MKAIIELGGRGSAIANARSQLAAAQAGQGIDYRLSFESARTLFSELTPACIDTLESLRAHGPMTIYALAKKTDRNYSNVHGDVDKLLEHKLAEKDAENRVFVPWDSVEIHMALARAA